MISTTSQRQRLVRRSLFTSLAVLTVGGASVASASTATTTPATTGDTTAGTTGDTTAGTAAGGGAAAEAGAVPASDLTLESGEVFVTGSSTVEPISIRVGELASQLSGGGLAVTVEGPGSGDGFALFCEGGADITDASRPIKEEEAQACADAGIDFVELEVGIDGLSVLTNPANTDVTCLDIPALYALLGPESEGFANWSDAAQLAAEVGSNVTTFPEQPLTIFAPGEESGTYDTFVEFAIKDLAEERGQEDVTRADYSANADDNLIIGGLEGADYSLGWVGYAYYAAEGDALKAIEIDGGDGCVAPTAETIGDGSYPFSRSLYIYVSKQAAESNPAVKSFVDLYLSQEGMAAVSDAGYVELPADRIATTLGNWSGMVTGTHVGEGAPATTAAGGTAPATTTAGSMAPATTMAATATTAAG